MRKTTYIYYSILAGILVSKIIVTIYQGSLGIHHGATIAQLQHERQELIDQKIERQQELSAKTALTIYSENLQESELEPIFIAVSISSDQTVAVVDSQR